MGAISRQLLPVLQLTRMALVFTAIADSACSLLLLAQWRAMRDGRSWVEHINLWQIGAMALVSIGLYGFGMSLNDIVDRRRDQQIAAHRPLPSGRIGVTAAHSICMLLVLLALAAGTVFAWLAPRDTGWMSVVLVMWTAMLIAFYDVGAKYLVAPGLLTLGLIRFFHAAIPAPGLPLLWHPLWLLNHVAILSAICYHLEAKRPPLTRGHWSFVIGGLAVLNAVAIGTIWLRRYDPALDAAASLWLEPGLALAGAAALIFIALGVVIYRRSAGRPQAGQQLMLYGLLWLIVYDAAFVAGYVNIYAALILALLLPVAYLSVQLMRWWSKVMALSQTPTFKRAES